jgi:hypothetical protein
VKESNDVGDVALVVGNANESSWVVHILVYAAFAYLSLRKVFVSLRGTGVFRSCGCRPPTIDQSEDNPKPKSSNLNFFKVKLNLDAHYSLARES